MNLPELFKQKMVGAFGNAGKDFLSRLEETIHHYENLWDIKVIRHVNNLSYNYVAIANDSNGKSVILKLGVPNFDFQNEVKTVLSYNGNGCVTVLHEDAVNGAMVLEYLFPGTMLFEEVEETSIFEFANVWKRIRRPAPFDWPYPTIMDWSNGLDRYIDNHSEHGFISAEMVYLAKSYFCEITESAEELLLLHGDLHHENILSSHEYGWIAIDPKGVVGDPYFDCTSFLINHIFEKENPKEVFINRIEMLVELLQLNKERLIKASFAMAMLYACWGVEDNDLNWAMNTYQCAKWLNELMGKRVS